MYVIGYSEEVERHVWKKDRTKERCEHEEYGRSRQESQSGAILVRLYIQKRSIFRFYLNA